MQTKPSEVEILNIGLALAMEFGSNWLQPINDRLSKQYKCLSQLELSEYNEACQYTMHKGHQYIYSELETLTNLKGQISSNDLSLKFDEYIKGEFYWVSGSNLKSLYSQSCYYAFKDGLDKVIID